jgi:two-component system response regulator AtoC
MARVVVVDDDEAVAYGMQSLLRSLNHEPVVARSGAEALELLDGAELVITDYSMPVMDGLDLLRAIRQRDETLPVVLLTAHGSDRIAARALRGGACGYVTKPFEFEEMAQVIARALQTRPPRPGGRLPAPAPPLPEAGWAGRNRRGTAR